MTEAELLWEVGFPIGPDVKAAAPLEIKDLPGGLQAVLSYEGSPEGIETAWTKLVAWVGANGYRPNGPMSMLFLGEPGPTGMRIELRWPVEKAQ